jgi:NAD(P)-dependent dehydrogenase (short-subunit alcohol dehydrogenase family)
MLLNEFTGHYARLLAPHIRVNAIAPGAILPAAHEGAASFAALAKKMPLKKHASLNNLLMALDYLMHNSAVTGQILYVDGGWHLQ